MTTPGHEVWQLHLAFEEASGAECFYAPSAGAAADILEYTENNEPALALELLLASSSTELPTALREHGYRVAEIAWPMTSEIERQAYVDAWLRWTADSGEDPPYAT